MKPGLSFLAGALAAIAFASQLWAADKEVDKMLDQTSADRSHLEPLGDVAKASDVIGEEVKNFQDEKSGKVEELVVDVESGRIIYAILSSGGILGRGSKHVAITPQSLRYDRANKVMRLDLSKEKLKGAPPFDLSKWEDYSASNRIVEIYRYYGERPYFVRTYPGKLATAPPTPPVHSMKATTLIGTAVKNKQDEKLGKVDDLIINIYRGRIVQVVVSSGGFLGIGDELSVMPPMAFRYDSSQSVLRVNTTKDELSRAPHFKNSDWPNLGDPQYADHVYRAYRIEPYFKVEADNTGRNASDRDGSQLTPMDQGTSSVDVDTTRRIRQELQAQDGLSVNARNVKIITVEGKVTLRGPVNSEDEKRLVAEIARRFASPDRLNNQLEVKGEPN